MNIVRSISIVVLLVMFPGFSMQTQADLTMSNIIDTPHYFYFDYAWNSGLEETSSEYVGTYWEAMVQTSHFTGVWATIVTWNHRDDPGTPAVDDTGYSGSVINYQDPNVAGKFDAKSNDVWWVNHRHDMAAPFTDKTSLTQHMSGDPSETIGTFSATHAPEPVRPTDKLTSRLVYTIQVESLANIADAQKKFNVITSSINKKNLNLLRIEKVGKYYTVRLGSFEHYETAKKFLQEIKPRLSGAIIMKAYIKKERIIKLYE